VLVAIASGSSADQHHDMVVLRFTSSGVVDTTFGASGKLALPLSIGDDVLTGLAVQADGKVLVTGRTFTPLGGTDVALLRLK
jgi:hypothetical protein